MCIYLIIISYHNLLQIILTYHNLSLTMINHGEPASVTSQLAGWPAGQLVRKLKGHEHACRRFISNQIGTNRIHVKKSIIVKGQNDVLTYQGVGLSAKY